MEENLVTVDKIIDWLTEQVEKKNPIDPHTWVDASQKLNLLLMEEQNKLFEQQQEVARLKSDLLDDPDMSVAKARVKIEGTNEYKESRKQEAKINRVIEMIRIAKLQARLAQEELKNYN